MFGMLDYRAYKLLWLICQPLRLVIWIAAWGSVVIAIMISASLHYSVLVRIVIAYAIWEGAATRYYGANAGTIVQFSESRFGESL